MNLHNATVIALAIAATAPGSGQETFLAGLDLRAPVAAFRLPPALREVSGLSIGPDGRLFAHGDERAELFELSPASGQVVGRFAVGEPALRGDFEGLALVGDRFYLVTSGGTLVEFRPGEPGHTLRETGLDGCEVEGLEHDPRSDSLLIACKQSRRGAVVVHTYDLGAGRLDSAPRIRIGTSTLRAAGPRELHPSGIVRLRDGGWLLVAAREHALLELAPDGRIRTLRELDADRHPQAEGIAVLPDGSLAIVDEGGAGRATLTIYRPRR